MEDSPSLRRIAGLGEEKPKKEPPPPVFELGDLIAGEGGSEEESSKTPSMEEDLPIVPSVGDGGVMVRVSQLRENRFSTYSGSFDDFIFNFGEFFVCHLAPLPEFPLHVSTIFLSSLHRVFLLFLSPFKCFSVSPLEAFFFAA